MKRSLNVFTPLLNYLGKATQPLWRPLRLTLLLAIMGCEPQPQWESAHCIDPVTKREVSETYCLQGNQYVGGVRPIWMYGGHYSNGHYAGGGHSAPLHNRYTTIGGKPLDARPGISAPPKVAPKSTPGGISSKGYSPSGFGARSTSSSS